MSYILQVFQPPAARPLRPADVVALVEELWEQSPPQGSSAYRELIRLVKASASPAQRGEWMQALADDDAGPVFNIAIDPGRAGQLVPLVVRCARTLRLAVMDEQAAIAYWPDGAEIRFPPPPVTSGAQDAMKASDLGPVQLPAGQEYLLYCCRTWMPAETLAEKLPEFLARNQRHPDVQPSEWLLALEKRLVREFGRHATAQSIWAQDLVPAGDLTEVMPLAVKAERIREVRPRILEIVQSVEKELFDPQAMQVHFPDGHISWRGGIWPPGWRGSELDADLPAAEIPKLLAPALQPHGFVPDRKGRFVRSFPHVIQRVEVFGSHWIVQVNLRIEVTQPTDVPDRIFPRNDDGEQKLCLWARLGKFVGDEDFDEPLFLDRRMNRSSIYQAWKIEPMAREIGRVLVERFLPCFDACTSVEAIHAAVNGPGAQERQAFWPVLPSHRLIIACMAGEPTVPGMAAHELAKLRAWEYDPHDARGLGRTEWEQELPLVEALVKWLEERGR